MPDLFRSYIRYARGESSPFSPWAIIAPLGVLMRPFVKARNALFDRGVLRSTDPPIPVISVGNLCHGGTNKTPMVEMLARRLFECGLCVGIVSRGYGGESKDPIQVGKGGASSDPQAVGDEPLMLASRLRGVRVVVSRDRLLGVRMLADLGCDVAVADDAFQHRKMGRDADIVLIDATDPFGNGRMFPAGILREGKDALSRADIVVITKSDQVSPDALASLKSDVENVAGADKVFTARLRLESWIKITGAEPRDHTPPDGRTAPAGRLVSFSAIGNPDSFNDFLTSHGADLVRTFALRDHHKFTWADLESFERAASSLGADGFVCTEKDLQNLPRDPLFVLPLYVPRIAVSLDSPDDLWLRLTRKIRPRIVITSNGYGEDAIGAMLACRVKDRFPSAEVSAFALVGSGKEYAARGIEVISPPSEMPSGGVVKYSLRALLKDVRHGLGRDIKAQIAAWRAMRGKYRTPLCVGDVYLLLIALWGQGMTPALIATAKSAWTNGHFGLERYILRRRARKVWTRDEATAQELARCGVESEFRGSPIMDLSLGDDDAPDPWRDLEPPHVLVLPGSRERAYGDIGMLLDTIRLLSEKRRCSFVMVLAPTIDREKLLSSARYEVRDGLLRVGGATVRLTNGSIASVARGADILIGLGGTANQVAAGLGVPVVSILEKGKLAQKKLLRDAELLVPATSEDLSAAVHALLDDPERMREMSEAGVRMLGGPGALDAVCEYAATELGWSARCRLYERMRDVWDKEAAATFDAQDVIINKNKNEDRGEEDAKWTEDRDARQARLMRAARMMRR